MTLQVPLLVGPPEHGALMSNPALPPEAWPRAHAAARQLLSPIQRFVQVEAASGLVLIAATLIALAWANSPWSASYHALWHIDVSLAFGPWQFARPLHFWVNDGLMTIFFLVVGLEIRRDMHDGELSDLRRAALPLIAALGGMLAPAAIYAALNAGRSGIHGWGIPVATDIAFAVGVLTLLSRRVVPALRIMLLALAVIDDIGAIVVIALFYSAGIAPGGLAIAAAGVAAVALLKGIGVRNAAIYVVPGIAVWAGLYAAGIHPSLAGVVLGLLTPVRAWSAAEGREPVSPAAGVQHRLHPWVAYGIMPVFALANAGVALGGASLSGDACFVFLGVSLGLFIGKPVGILLACLLARRWTTPPTGVTAGGLATLGTVAGIGFTMSLFVAQLAFKPGPMLETAKTAVLTGSLAAALVGYGLGRAILRPR
jgi:NhaA family Na+:H+ antiporter